MIIKEVQIKLQKQIPMWTEFVPWCAQIEDSICEY